MRKGVKAAKLAYRVLEEATPLTLVHIRLYTGRSHQIRVQFASRGFPLAGDHKYGSRDDIRSPALWSFRLTLPHPVTGETIPCLHPPEGELWHTFPMISREIPRW
ncbi:pseudouridine synthase [Firmicutes bacterium CAG:137]|nr:pseudouridine synthase [Firmicutes bacterium CAG:137]